MAKISQKNQFRTLNMKVHPAVSYMILFLVFVVTVIIVRKNRGC